MNILSWILWGVLLIGQNAAFTLVSRARNSSSLWYHAWAAVFSNGIWFASQFILVNEFVKIISNGDWIQGVGVGLFYTVCTLVGSLGMHHLAMHKLEKKHGR